MWNKHILQTHSVGFLSRFLFTEESGEQQSLVAFSNPSLSWLSSTRPQSSFVEREKERERDSLSRVYIYLYFVKECNVEKSCRVDGTKRLNESSLRQLYKCNS